MRTYSEVLTVMVGLSTPVKEIDSLRRVCSAMALSFDQQTEVIGMLEHMYRDRSREDLLTLLVMA